MMEINNGYDIAKLFESKDVPDLLNKLQRSHDTFEEDWNYAWDHYEKCQEELNALKGVLVKMARFILGNRVGPGDEHSESKILLAARQQDTQPAPTAEGDV